MPELTRDHRFLPCLLDRLRDDDPKNQEESRNQRVISMQRYKEAVLRDLQWLLNSSAHIPTEGEFGIRLRDYPEAFRSVLNFGTRQLCGVSAPDLETLERELNEAIRFFEPRFIGHTLKISASKDRHILSFEMVADLWAEPISEQLFVKTSIDLETGQVALGDGTRHG